MRLKKVVLVWAIKEMDALKWVQDELETAIANGESGPGFSVTLRIHVTGSAGVDSESLKRVTDGQKVTSKTEISVVDGDAAEVESDKGSATTRSRLPGASYLSGRPDMRHSVEDLIQNGGKFMVIGCGPEGFRLDLANAVAEAQKRVMAGACEEIALHLETFGW